MFTRIGTEQRIKYKMRRGSIYFENDERNLKLEIDFPILSRHDKYFLKYNGI